MQNIVRNHFALIGKADKIDSFRRVHVEMKLFGFYVNIARQNVVENDIFDKADLVVLLAVQALDIEERHRKHTAKVCRLRILALHGDDVFRARIRAERTIGVAVGGDDGSVLVKAAKHFGSGFTDMHKVGAGNNDAGVVEHVDRLSDIFFKLIDYALKYSC